MPSNAAATLELLNPTCFKAGALYQPSDPTVPGVVIIIPVSPLVTRFISFARIIALWEIWHNTFSPSGVLPSPNTTLKGLPLKLRVSANKLVVPFTYFSIRRLQFTSAADVDVVRASNPICMNAIILYGFNGIRGMRSTKIGRGVDGGRTNHPKI